MLQILLAWSKVAFIVKHPQEMHGVRPDRDPSVKEDNSRFWHFFITGTFFFFKGLQL